MMPRTPIEWLVVLIFIALAIYGLSSLLSGILGSP